MEGTYRKLGLALGINTALMLAITYAMIASFGHLFININRIYMALMMAAPMGIVMLLVMRPMYRNVRRNLLLHVLFAGLFLTCFALARTQTPIGDGQFLRSMIPHHSSAVLMCEEARITDPEIVDLCDQIVRAQLEEIALMKEMLARH